MGNNREVTEKDIRIVQINDKYGFQTPDGTWLAEPEFDKSYEFEGGYARVVKDGLEGWISFDEENGDYCPWSDQERWLRENKRKRERKKKIRRMLGLRESKPMDLDWWDDDEHSWIVNRLHYGWEKFKENPLIPVTIIFAIAVLIYTFFFE